MSPRTHPNDEPAARSDAAVRAAEDAVWAVARERAGAEGFEALGPVEVTRIAVEAARPIIEAEALNVAAAQIIIPGDSSEAANWLRAVAKIGLRR